MRNDMACKRCEISTFVKDNGVVLLFVTETLPSAHGDDAKSVEIAPSGFDVQELLEYPLRSVREAVFRLPILVLLFIMLYVMLAY